MEEIIETKMNDDPILRVCTKIIVGPIILFGLYVQFHGDYGPGGGFQAGVIVAAGFILHSLIFGLKEGRKLVSENLNLNIMILGVLLYGGVGLISLYFNTEFLNYSILAHDSKHGQHIGILLIEFGVGLTVAGVMLILFHLFSSWKGTSK
jgi:multicomponent Na+:H+ antiporter subunit B